jgi:DNA polymerase-3 subunit epsilon
MSFDESVMGSEFIRAGVPNILTEKKRICTMRETTDLLALPGAYGNKFPKLIELHKFLFGNEFEGAHNALTDISATAKCFWELKERGLIDNPVTA